MQAFPSRNPLFNRARRRRLSTDEIRFAFYSPGDGGRRRVCLYCSSAVDADGPPKYVTKSGESFKWILLDITETGR